MMTARNVVIIGGGIAGMATAYFLQERARAANMTLCCTLVESGPALAGKYRQRERMDSSLKAARIRS